MKIKWIALPFFRNEPSSFARIESVLIYAQPIRSVLSLLLLCSSIVNQNLLTLRGMSTSVRSKRYEWFQLCVVFSCITLYMLYRLPQSAFSKRWFSDAWKLKAHIRWCLSRQWYALAMYPMFVVSTDTNTFTGNLCALVSASLHYRNYRAFSLSIQSSSFQK